MNIKLKLNINFETNEALNCMNFENETVWCWQFQDKLVIKLERKREN